MSSTLSLQPYSSISSRMETRPNTPAPTNVVSGHTIFRNTLPFIPGNPVQHNPFTPAQTQASINTPALWSNNGLYTPWDTCSTPALSYRNYTAGLASYDHGATTDTVNSMFNGPAQPAENSPWRVGQLEATNMYLTRSIQQLRQEILEVNGQAAHANQLALECFKTVRELHAKVSLNEELGERVTALEVQVDLMNRGVGQYDNMLGKEFGGMLDDRAKSV